MYSGNLGTGDMEGGGTVLVRALDAGTVILIGIVAVAEHTLLQWEKKNRLWSVIPFRDKSP